MIPPRSVINANEIQTIEDVNMFGTCPIDVLGESMDADTAFIQNLILTNLPNLQGADLKSWENFFYETYPKDFNWEVNRSNIHRSLELENELRNLVKAGDIPPIEGL